MKRQDRIAALIVAILLTHCATGQVTPLQRAELTYVEASIGYEAAQNVVVAARAQHLVNDQAWKIFDDAQVAVQTEAPKVRRMLTEWRASGVKPVGIDAALVLLQGAADTATKIREGVHP